MMPCHRQLQFGLWGRSGEKCKATNGSKGWVRVPKRMNFRKSSKRQLTPTPTPQNGPHLWKSCACISYYLAIIPPRIYATMSIIKEIAI